MSNDMTSAIEARATDWVIRQRDPDFADWERFADWLDEDSRHLAVYDLLASMDVDLGSLPVPARPASVVSFEVPKRSAPTRRAWLGGAAAAALVGMIGYSFIGAGATRIETIAGEHRTLDLADGSRIEINGATVLELDKARPRFAKLESGEAMFHVVHRAGDPFTVDVGNAKLVDLGTAFNIVRRENATSVAVSQGIVLYNPDRENVRLIAGKAIEARDGAARPKLVDIDVHNVGGWRTGQLVYTSSSLGEVAQDLNRTTGMTISVSPAVRALPFRGALLIGKDRNRTIDDLTALAGIRAEKTTDGWLLTR
jgi:transmembrane sensor